MKNKAIIFDLDGTVYYGNQLIEGSMKAIYKCKQLNYEILFFTNNSSKNRKEIFSKLIALGVDCTLSRVYNSSYATALYLKQNNIKNIFVIGTDSFKDELKNLSINIVSPENAKAVAVGFNPFFTYQDISDGLLALSNGALLIASNVDKNFPVENNQVRPACNAIVSSLIGSCTKEIDPIIIGKPNTYMLDIICKDWNLNKQNIWVIGDSEESDIEMAKRYDCKSILVGKNGVSVKNIDERIVE